MGLLTGLQPGLEVALNTGLGTSVHSSGIALPATPSDLADKLGDAAAVASDIWLMQEASGNLTGTEGTVLTATGGAMAYQQPVVGDVGGYSVPYCIQSDSDAKAFDAATAAVFDSDGTSFAAINVFRATADELSHLMTKVGSQGYYLRLFSGGTVRMLCLDDAANQQIAQVAGAHTDGNWHVAIGGYHATDNTSHCYTELGSDTDSAPAHTGSMSDTAVFQLFESGNALQMCYHAQFEGAAAEALLDLGADAISNFWG